MTGNDALEYITNLLLVNTTIGRNSGKSYTLKAIYKLSEELELLEKYKRALEILKDKGFNGREVISHVGYDYRTRTFTKEEYELIKELM